MYSQWIPVMFENLNNVPYMDNFIANHDGLYVNSNFNTGNKIIHFENYLVLRVIDEGNALKILEKQNFDGKNWIFVTSESDLIDWFNNQSYCIHENQYNHYIYVSQHKILEILSSCEPVILESGSVT